MIPRTSIINVSLTAESRYNILFTPHQDRAIWLGNLLFLIPAFGGNMLLISLFDFAGIDYASILSSLVLLAWRWWFA